MASPRRGQRSLIPCLDPHPQSHLLLSGSPAGPYISCHQRRPPQAGGLIPLWFPKSFNPARHSSWADVKPCKEGLLLDLKLTKTLQTQQGVTTIPIAAVQDKRIYPISSWELFRHMLPWFTPDSSTPLLLTTAPPVGKVISASTFRAMFHRASLSAKQYTPHSLRCGGASFLEHIKKHGTWTSHSVDRYLFQHQVFQTPVAQAFQAALTSPQS